MQEQTKQAKKFTAVFLPYKASMWDSLESVWMAAEADPNCDAYVVPIPYYDKNPDGSFKQEHYEGNLYPEYVPITRYDEFDLEEVHPDVIFIHNPYDNENNVTSVHPYFYSSNLKKFTDTLVYIPYYSTTGGMSEGQYSCPAYYHADYIVIQAEKYRKFFDASLPQDKFLALGTPKFDKVIRVCQNPPKPPAEWQEKMEGKRVYFYNTSLAGMLQNTPNFLKKMEYVFRCFMNREDACLLWRPHPLMESTFDSMRPAYKPIYEALKNTFINYNLGIYDTTPDITDTIALSDVYIGDAGTSVTSLFGIAGKPLFILNNDIHTAPEADDWRGTVIRGLSIYGNNAWMVTQGNKLYYALNNDFKYEYYCNLNEYGKSYYSQVITIKDKSYVCPCNAQDILILEDKGDKRGIERKIELQHLTNRSRAFSNAVDCGKYLFLIPYNYPAIVRYDTEKDEVSYFSKNLSIFIAVVNGQKRIGDCCVLGEYLFIASPVDNRMLTIHAASGKEQILNCNREMVGGCAFLSTDGVDLWMMPYSGTVITRWNPFSGETEQYNSCTSEAMCENTATEYLCIEQPFAYPAFVEEYVYLPPYKGNAFFRLNKCTGEMIEWKPDFELPQKVTNGYFLMEGKCAFLEVSGNYEGKEYLLCSYLDRKVYDVNLETGKCREVCIEFDMAELQEHISGFSENSEWLGYVCEEDAFNSISDFLNGNVKGKTYDRKRQIEQFHKISENVDGTCGKSVYEFVKDNAQR